MPLLRLFRALPIAVAVAASALLAVAFTSAVGEVPAATSPPAASATIALSSKAVGSRALQKAKVKVTALKPVTVSKTRWKLPLHGAPAIDATSIALDGELRFGVGKRQVSFIGMRLSFGAKPTITGALGKKKYNVLTLGGAPKRDLTGRTIRFAKTSVSLSSSAAKAIRKQLKLKRAVTGRIGTLSLTAAATPSVTPTPTTTATSPTTTAVAPPPVVTTTTTAPPVTTTTTPTTPTTPMTPVDPFEADCTVGATSQAAPSVSQVVDPTLAGTPATGAALSWGLKQSFREYIVNIAAGSLVGRLGATYAADAFTFPFSSGTTTYPQVPVKAVVHEVGTAIFCGLGHGFRIAIADPTVVIDGSDSRLIADVSLNDTGALSGPNRVSVATLNMTGIAPVYDAGAKTITWSGIPANLTADASASFAGFYEPGTELDPITVVVSVP